MDIEEALKQAPKNIRESSLVISMVELIRYQTALIQEQTVQIQEQTVQIQEQTVQIQGQAEQIVALKATVEDLKDEISRLNNTPKRPKFRPSKIGSVQKPKKAPKNTRFKINENSLPLNKVKEEITIRAENIPNGSRFKGYAEFQVQEVVIVVKEIFYKLEVWQALNGQVIRAKLPKEQAGKHFGPNLRALILNLYVQGMTEPTIHSFLQSVGVRISTGQISNLMLDLSEKLSETSEAILKAGLQEAPYIRVDDTGAMHKHKNSYCTHIGGEHFAYYKTTFSKSRENFLSLLSQENKSYLINDAMMHHLSRSGIKDATLHLFEKYKGKEYSKESELHKLLNKLGLTNKKVSKKCLEGAWIGFISEKVLKSDQVLLSDRAGQFAILDHAACWVHMERPLRKLVASSKAVEEEINQVRDAIWKVYHQLKKAMATQESKEAVINAYDKLVEMKSTSPAVNKVLNDFRKYKDELLKGLDHPELPLHNNDSERDIRSFVKRRKISGSTKSEKGKKFRDSLASVKQTCFRVGISFWDYCCKFIRGQPPDLAQIVTNKYRSSTLQENFQ